MESLARRKTRLGFASGVRTLAQATERSSAFVATLERPPVVHRVSRFSGRLRDDLHLPERFSRIVSPPVVRNQFFGLDPTSCNALAINEIRQRVAEFVGERQAPASPRSASNAFSPIRSARSSALPTPRISPRVPKETSVRPLTSAVGEFSTGPCAITAASSDPTPRRMSRACLASARRVHG